MDRNLSSYLVIPARLESTRLPEKMLLCETGKPLIQHTYEAAARARKPSALCVATDSQRIAFAVRQFGGNVVLTEAGLASGTDRVAKVAETLVDVDLLVNVQGDEPEIAGNAIDLAIDLLERDPTADMATLATPIRSLRQFQDPNCVKVVTSAAGHALYFSRSPIPYGVIEHPDMLAADPPLVLQHVGLYAYRREFLSQLASLPPAPLEQLERLEQLRALAVGATIAVGTIDEPTEGIDTVDDYARFVSRVANRREPVPDRLAG